MWSRSLGDARFETTLNEAPNCYDESGARSAATIPDAADAHLGSAVLPGPYIAQLFRSAGGLSGAEAQARPDMNTKAVERILCIVPHRQYPTLGLWRVNLARGCRAVEPD